MESNITEPQYLPDESLGEPHFDQEATVASARPVVPLEEIKAESKSRKRLVFGLSMLASLIIGVLSATLVYKQRNSKPAASIVEGAISGAGAKSDDLAFDDGAVGDTTEDLAEAEQSAPVAEQAPREPVVAPNEPVVRNANPPRKPTIIQPDEEEIRQMERKQARRLRRRAERLAEREARGRRRPPDDVLRIREIFEGSRRP